MDSPSGINSTSVSGHPLQWNLQAVIMTIIDTPALLINASVLLLFLKVKIISFDIYLMNLLLANLLYLIAACPLDILHALYDPRWPLSYSACTFYLYTLWAMQYTQGYAHVLIALTRVWAIGFPVSYREHATITRSVALCCAAWGLAHLQTLPGILMDALMFRLPVEQSGCQVNVDTVSSQKHWLLFLQIMAVVDETIILVSYGFIWHKRRQRSKARTPSHRRSRDSPGELNADRIKTTVIDTSTITMKDVRTNVPTNDRRMPTVVSVRRPSNSHGSSGFLLLTLLTTSLVICWTPMILYFLIISFISTTYDPRIATATTLLFNVQTLVDPILFTLALPHLRSLVCNSKDTALRSCFK